MPGTFPSSPVFGLGAERGQGAVTSILFLIHPPWDLRGLTLNIHRQTEWLLGTSQIFNIERRGKSENKEEHLWSCQWVCS